MTKSFCWHDDPFELAEEFERFFGNAKNDYFTSWLTHSFVVYVYDESIEKIECSLVDGIAKFDIVFNDHYGRSAGTANVLCTTELLNEFLDRILRPLDYCEN